MCHSGWSPSRGALVVPIFVPGGGTGSTSWRPARQREPLPYRLRLVEGERFNWGAIWGPITIPEIIVAGVVLFAIFVIFERFQASP